jgi:hypothetical protein
MCKGHYDRWRCSGVVGGMLNSYPLDRRLWGSVDRGSLSDCWHWTGKLTAAGYGTGFWVNGRQRAAHVVAWMLASGAEIPPGFVLDHECHNAAIRAAACPGGACPHRSCCNPAHLVLRTRQEHADASPSWGGRTPTRILDDNDVIAIRSELASGETGAAIARRYDVSPQLVSFIKTGRRKVSVR